MVRVSEALEDEVAAIRRLQARPRETGFDCRHRAQVELHYAVLLRLMAPRTRHFTRVYGLLDHAEDAAQACAIALVCAIDTYDPARARFTTLLNWQLRGELQALRFRLRDDRRESARRVGAATLSLDALLAAAGEGVWARDDAALIATERSAADAMARRACGSLLRQWRQDRGGHAPARRLATESGIAEAWLIGEDEERAAALAGSGLTVEQGRQIARRISRALSALAIAPVISERLSRH